MIVRAAARQLGLVAAWLVLGTALAGCSTVSKLFAGPDDAAPPDTSIAEPQPPPVSERAVYRIVVDAPGPLQKLLLTYLDLSRFQSAPETESITRAELDRLATAAPAQARSLLETEGYVNADVSVTREDAPDGGVPVLRVRVVPGPRTTIESVTLNVTGPLDKAVQAGDAAAASTLATVRRDWSLTAGEPFRQGDWSSAKNNSLARLRGLGYASAVWAETNARIDAQTNRAQLRATAESGPLFLLGEIRVEGLQKHTTSSVLNLATFHRGTPYSERLLLDYQERLQKSDLFEGSSVEIEPDPANAAAVPVLVRVREQRLQQATLGLGYSANNGPRTTLEHTHRRPFGFEWIARSKLEFGSAVKLVQLDLTSHPKPGQYRNLIAGAAEKLRSGDEVRTSASLRIGRTQDTSRIERLYFGEITQARIDNPLGSATRRAVTANYHWSRREVDNVLLPTAGYTLAAQGAVGHAWATDADNGPFARAYSRLTWYRPLGGWYATTRLEAGQIFSRPAVGVPDTLLFRAGGDDSVRGYAYRTLGPEVAGVVTSGRMLLTGSAEIARPISPRYPAIWWAAFVDGGQAANSWGDLRPVYGYGLGVRWRSPVGPLRVDLAYGEAVRKVRMHLSVGIAL